MSDPAAVLLIRDFMSTTRIELALDTLGLKAIYYAEEDLNDFSEDSDPLHRPGEPITGRDGYFFSQITMWQPALIIMDLGDDYFPWERWLSYLRSSPATRRIPVICFGPHTEKEKLARARDLTADVVMPRSRFFRELNTLLSENVRNLYRDEVASLCQEPLSAAARRGIDEFNKGNYYDAHEYLEDAWNEDSTIGRDLYRAVLQIAVAYLQIERANFAGAIKMILRSRQWFAPLPAICRGINVMLLQKDAESVYKILNSLGPDGISEFDLTMLRPVEIVE